MEPELAAALTAELRGFVARAGTRRALPTTCHVGRPGGERIEVATPVSPTVVLDQSLRADLVERALDGLLDLEGACAWVTRGGTPETDDLDLGWYAAARQAFERHGLVLATFAVLTRTGWVDLVSGERRAWRRVRRRHTGQV